MRKEEGVLYYHNSDIHCICTCHTVTNIVTLFTNNLTGSE